MDPAYEEGGAVPSRVLVTGASGTTGACVSEALRRRGATPIEASRHGAANGRDRVRLDWDDPTTFATALDGVSAVYVVPPPGSTNPAAVVLPFLRLGAERGLRRVVLLGAASVGAGDGGVGQLYGALAGIVPEWAVLRPSWFMQNFIGEHQQARSIRADGVIRSATGDGAVPFIDAGDIAGVAATLLLADQPPHDEIVLTGSRALTYDEVAAVITEVAGRPVRHERLTVEQMRDDVFADLPRDFADVLARMDVEIAEGRWQATTEEVERITGRRPISFEQFARAHRASWL